EIIPGRALSLTTTWHNSETFTIINVYAPNDYSQHPTFWENITLGIRTLSIPLPDFMVGDFNVVEELVDRSPPRPDPLAATNALRELRLNLGLTDGWRHDNPDERAYTYTSNRHHMPRIDRIYTKPTHLPYLHGWHKTPTSIPTDHCLIEVQFSPPSATFVGVGQWTWPLGLLNDPALLQQIHQRRCELLETLTLLSKNRSTDHNPQTAWKTFKSDIASLGKKHAKVVLAKISRKITDLEADIKDSLNHPTLGSGEASQTNAAFLQ
ncbi:DNase I-like protein, partial [Gloeophyllum trabeum ATCC 11539]